MLRMSIAGIENHFSTAAWTPRNNALHSFAPTNYLRFPRDGPFAWFTIPWETYHVAFMFATFCHLDFLLFHLFKIVEVLTQTALGEVSFQ